MSEVDLLDQSKDVTARRALTGVDAWRESLYVAIPPLDCARCGKHYDENPGSIYVEVPGYKKAGVCVACVADVFGMKLVPVDEEASDAEVPQPVTP